MSDIISHFQHRIYERYGYVPSPRAVRVALKMAYRLDGIANPSTDQVYRRLPR